MARRRRDTEIVIPRGLSRWWVEKLMEGGMTLDEAIAEEQRREERRADSRIVVRKPQSRGGDDG